LSREEDFTVTVNNVNEAPTDITFTGGAKGDTTVDENAATNTVVANLGAADPDTGSTFTYTFSNGLLTDPSGRFKIVNNNGVWQIQVANGSLLNHEANGSHVVRVRVTDNGNPALSREEDFTVTVNNVNEAPSAPTIPANVQINETAGGGTAVANLNAVDPEGGPITFLFVDSLLGSNGLVSADGRFKIVGGQIQVNSNAALQVDVDTDFTYGVTASDGVHTSNAGNITIRVRDGAINPAPTTIRLNGQEVVSVDENSQVIGTLSAIDSDGIAGYRITAGNPDGIFEVVQVGNTWQIRVAPSKVLDYEDLGINKFYDLQIEARDTKGATSTHDIRVNVDNQVIEGNPPPTDPNPAVHVNENSGQNTVIATLRSLSGSSNQSQVFYKIFVNGKYELTDGRFKIVDNKVVVAENAVLDYENSNNDHSYTITILAHDLDGGRRIEDLTINLNNVNEKPIDILLNGETAPTTITVSELAATNTQVAELSAADLDGPDTFTYKLLDTSGRFQIVGNKIVVANGVKLDYEQFRSHSGSNTKVSLPASPLRMSLPSPP
jgi:hypothetical protein